MSDPKYAYPYPPQGYYQGQGPPVMAPPQYQYASQPPPKREERSFIDGCLAALCCCCLLDECCCDPSVICITYLRDECWQYEWSGSHVVLLFSRPPKIDGAPEMQLIGFDRVRTVPNRSTETTILVDPCNHLSFADENVKRIMPLGDHVFMVGALEHYVSIEAY